MRIDRKRNPNLIVFVAIFTLFLAISVAGCSDYSDTEGFPCGTGEKCPGSLKCCSGKCYKICPDAALDKGVFDFRPDTKFDGSVPDKPKPDMKADTATDGPVPDKPIVVDQGIDKSKPDIKLDGPVLDKPKPDMKPDTLSPDWALPDKGIPDLKPDQGNSCVPNPCLNGGTCNKGVCKCATGYDGKTCNKCKVGYYKYPFCLVDPCHPNPCLNKGTCSNATGVAKCSCAKGYDGKTCNTCATGYYKPTGSTKCVDDPCLPDPCNGNGTCSNSTGAAVCTCNGNWALPKCSGCKTGWSKTSGCTKCDSGYCGAKCSPNPTVSNVDVDCSKWQTGCPEKMSFNLSFDYTNASSYKLSDSVTNGTKGTFSSVSGNLSPASGIKKGLTYKTGTVTSGQSATAVVTVTVEGDPGCKATGTTTKTIR